MTTGPLDRARSGRGVDGHGIPGAHVLGQPLPQAWGLRHYVLAPSNSLGSRSGRNARP